jgi:hypothetical protein
MSADESKSVHRIGDESFFMPGGYDIAALAAGGAIAVTDAVINGSVSNAYALCRWGVWVWVWVWGFVHVAIGLGGGCHCQQRVRAVQVGRLGRRGVGVGVRMTVRVWGLLGCPRWPEVLVEGVVPSATHNTPRSPSQSPKTLPIPMHPIISQG